MWKLGPVGPFAAVVAMRDLQWPWRESPLHRLFQMVFITEAELREQGEARRALFERLYENRDRLLNRLA